MIRPSQQPTYLITGGAGFIGSHLAEGLLAAGHAVLIIDDVSTGSMANIAHLLGKPNLRVVRSSIMDNIVLDRLTSQADVVVHLAAAVGVKMIIERPVQTIEANVMGTEAVLKAALRYGCRVVLASSSEVYGKGQTIPMREEDDVLLGATSKSRWSYAASKMVDEFLTLAYEQEYGLRVVIMRLFNTVGPRQTGRYGMVIPRFIRQALRGEPITVYGDGSQSRCFCDVRDVVQACMELARVPKAPERVYNVGSTEEICMRELARRVKAISGSQSPIVNVPYATAYAPGFEDMQRRVPETSRIRNLLGWQPQRSLDDILEDVIQYERKATH